MKYRTPGGNLAKLNRRCGNEDKSGQPGRRLETFSDSHGHLLPAHALLWFDPNEATPAIIIPYFRLLLLLLLLGQHTNGMTKGPVDSSQHMTRPLVPKLQRKPFAYSISTGTKK